jgi:hypothetical protein
MKSDLSRRSPYDGCKAVKPRNENRNGHEAGKPIQKIIPEGIR